MAIDPRISLFSTPPPAPTSPFDTAIKGESLRNLIQAGQEGQMQLEAARAQQREAGVLAEIISGEGTPDEKAERVRTEAPLSYNTYMTERAALEQNISEADEAELDTQVKRGDKIYDDLTLIQGAPAEERVRRYNEFKENWLKENPNATDTEKAGLPDIGNLDEFEDYYLSVTRRQLTAKDVLAEDRAHRESVDKQELADAKEAREDAAEARRVAEERRDEARYTAEAAAGFPNLTGRPTTHEQKVELLRTDPETYERMYGVGGGGDTVFDRQVAMFRENPQEFFEFMNREPSIAADMLASSQIGEYHPDDTLWNRLGWFTTGPLSVLPRTLGRLTGTGQESLGNIQAFESSKNTMIRALAENPRFAVAEAERLAREVNIQPGSFDSTTTIRTRMREIDAHLKAVEVRRTKMGDTASVLALQQFRAQMGVPAGAGEASAESGPITGDTQQHQGATYMFDGTKWVKQ